MSAAVPGSAQWISDEENYYYTFFGSVLDSSVPVTKSLCEALNFKIASYLHPSLSQGVQDAYVSLKFEDALEYYNERFHRRSISPFVIISVYLAITSALFVIYRKDERIKNGSYYCTSLALIGILIFNFSTIVELVAEEGFNCNVAYYFFNIAFYFWGTGSVCRAFSLVLRSRLATIHNRGDNNIERNIWVRMARLKLGSDWFLAKMVVLFSPISLIPSIVISARNEHITFFRSIGICPIQAKKYIFGAIMLMSCIIALMVLLVLLRNVVSDIYYIRHQLIAYCIIFPTIAVPVIITLLSKQTFTVKYSTGYFSALYLPIVLVFTHQTVTITYPLCMSLRSYYRSLRVKRKMKRRDFSTFATLIMDPDLWVKFCDFSVRCFTEENTHFIRQYLELLDVMRANGRIFCTAPSDESYVFHGTVPTMMAKVKAPAVFDSRYHLLFTYCLPLDRLLIFDVEPAEAEKDCLTQMYNDFFSVSAPYALNIPSDMLKSVRNRFETNNLSILMLEEIKKAVLTMLYENTFYKFTEVASVFLSDTDSHPTSYDSGTKRSEFAITTAAIAQTQTLSHTSAQVRSEDNF